MSTHSPFFIFYLLILVAYLLHSLQCKLSSSFFLYTELNCIAFCIKYIDDLKSVSVSVFVKWYQTRAPVQQTSLTTTPYTLPSPPPTENLSLWIAYVQKNSASLHWIFSFILTHSHIFSSPFQVSDDMTRRYGGGGLWAMYIRYIYILCWLMRMIWWPIRNLLLVCIQKKRGPFFLGGADGQRSKLGYRDGQ